VSTEPGYMVRVYRSADRRRRIGTRLSVGDPLSSDDIDLLRGLHRPVFLILDGSDDAATARLEATYGAPVHRDGGLAIYRVIE
jgi:hypothetical protein